MPYCPSCEQEFVAGVEYCPECGAQLEPIAPPARGNPTEHLVDVFATNDPAEADIVAGLLRANGIECSGHSGVPQNVLPLHVDRMEEIRIYVAEHNAETARALIAAHPDTPSGD